MSSAKMRCKSCSKRVEFIVDTPVRMNCPECGGMELAAVDSIRVECLNCKEKWELSSGDPFTGYHVCDAKKAPTRRNYLFRVGVLKNESPVSPKQEEKPKKLARRQTQ